DPTDNRQITMYGVASIGAACTVHQPQRHAQAKPKQNERRPGQNHPVHVTHLDNPSIKVTIGTIKLIRMQNMIDATETNVSGGSNRRTSEACCSTWSSNRSVATARASGSAPCFSPQCTSVTSDRSK